MQNVQNLRGNRFSFTGIVKTIGTPQTTQKNNIPFVKVDVEVTKSDNTKRIISATYYLQSLRGTAIEPPKVDNKVECYGDMDEFGDIKFFTARPLLENVSVEELRTFKGRLITKDMLEERRATMSERNVQNGIGATTNRVVSNSAVFDIPAVNQNIAF